MPLVLIHRLLAPELPLRRVLAVSRAMEAVEE